MSVTITELEERALEIKKLRADRDEKKIIYNRANEEVDAKELEFMAKMEESEIASYRSKVGIFSLVGRTSVKFPQDLENRKLVEAWAREQGIFYELYSINSASLNALYKREKLAAEEKGELFFRLPGISDPTISSYLSVRKA